MVSLDASERSPSCGSFTSADALGDPFSEVLIHVLASVTVLRLSLSVLNSVYFTNSVSDRSFLRAYPF